MNRNNSKRWLLSKLKSSGSKKKFDYAEDYKRQKTSTDDMENLPKRESMHKSESNLRAKLNLGPLVKFLGSNLNKNWDHVYSEYCSRIPNELEFYKDIIYDFVADKVEIRENEIINLRTGKKIFIKGKTTPSFNYEYKKFFVHPESNLLLKT